jgi:hypothetical protein
MNNMINKNYLEQVIDGITFTVDFSIQGEYLKDESGKRIIEKVVNDEKTGKATTFYKVAFPRTTVRHTFDFTGCTLGQAIKRACAGSSLVVEMSNQARALGIDAVNALNNGTTIVKNTLDGKVRLVGSPKDKALKAIDSITDDNALDEIEKKLEEIKARRLAMKNNVN